eukprot:GHVP01011451.1.p2 GENE.GHVP01011451.1~~GHVP01011451.1.p2  ORF type:complete len:409 (-),score=120.96 GHVP01011451.1:1005-2231(-)
MKNKDSQYVCDVNYEFSLPPEPEDVRLLNYTHSAAPFCRYRPLILEFASRSGVISDSNVFEALESALLEPEAFVSRDGETSCLREADGNLICPILPAAAQIIANDPTPRDLPDVNAPTKSEEITKSPEDIIEEQFTMANDPTWMPIHPTKPHIKAKRIMHILPHESKSITDFIPASIEDLNVDPKRMDVMLSEPVSRLLRRFFHFRESSVEVPDLNKDGVLKDKKVFAHQRNYICQVLAQSKEDRRVLIELPPAPDKLNTSDDNAYLSVLYSKKLIMKKSSQARTDRGSKPGLLVVEFDDKKETTEAPEASGDEKMEDAEKETEEESPKSEARDDAKDEDEVEERIATKGIGRLKVKKGDKDSATDDEDEHANLPEEEEEMSDDDDSMVSLVEEEDGDDEEDDDDAED